MSYVSSMTSYFIYLPSPPSSTSPLHPAHQPPCSRTTCLSPAPLHWPPYTAAPARHLSFDLK